MNFKSKLLIVSALSLFLMCKVSFIGAEPKTFLGRAVSDAEGQIEEIQGIKFVAKENVEAINHGSLVEKADGAVGLLGLSSFLKHFARKINFSKTSASFLETKEEYEELFLKVSSALKQSFVLSDCDNDVSSTQKIQMMLKHYLIIKCYGRPATENDIIVNGKVTAIYNKEFYGHIKTWVEFSKVTKKVFNRLCLTFIELSFYKTSLQHISLKACASKDVEFMKMYLDDSGTLGENLSKATSKDISSSELKRKINRCRYNLEQLNKMYHRYSTNKSVQLFEENCSSFGATAAWFSERLNMAPGLILKGQSMSILASDDFNFESEEFNFGSSELISGNESDVNIACS